MAGAPGSRRGRDGGGERRPVSICPRRYPERSAQPVAPEHVGKARPRRRGSAPRGQGRPSSLPALGPPWYSSGMGEEEKGSHQREAEVGLVQPWEGIKRGAERIIVP